MCFCGIWAGFLYKWDSCMLSKECTMFSMVLNHSYNAPQTIRSSTFRGVPQNMAFCTVFFIFFTSVRFYAQQCFASRNQIIKLYLSYKRHPASFKMFNYLFFFLPCVFIAACLVQVQGSDPTMKTKAGQQ